MAAARAAVRPDIDQARERARADLQGFAECEASGQLIPLSELELDHFTYEFVEIVDIWLRVHNFDDLESLTTRDELDFPAFVDQIVADSFRLLHSQLAELRWIEKGVHRRQKRKARKLPKKSIRVRAPNATDFGSARRSG